MADVSFIPRFSLHFAHLSLTLQAIFQVNPSSHPQSRVGADLQKKEMTGYVRKAVVADRPVLG